jgi:hypothetical protein
LSFKFDLHRYGEVHVVETEEEARRVLAILLANVGDADRPVYHAVDTEVGPAQLVNPIMTRGLKAPGDPTLEPLK